MNKRNYNAEMREEMRKGGGTLLLHSCCGPCSSRCIETLKNVFAVTVYYYNPNITDSEEYARRKSEQIRFLRETGWADYLDSPYDPEAFFSCAEGLEKEKEGGARCYRCFDLRIRKTAAEAKSRGYDYFCTTLSVSPHKNAVWLNEIGERAAAETGVQWLPADFKKENGYQRSVQLAREYGLYRQNYCGCVFSKEERETAERKKGKGLLHTE